MIAIVDYKAGNLTSVKKAFDHLGAETVVTSDPAQVAKADQIVLPGVGHFAATSALNDSGLRDSIVDSIERHVPFLGICVGMQWMLASSEEAPGDNGLGFFPQVVRALPTNVKSPHIGWNQVRRTRESALLRGIPDELRLEHSPPYRPDPLRPRKDLRKPAQMPSRAQWLCCSSLRLVEGDLAPCR